MKTLCKSRALLIVITSFLFTLTGFAQKSTESTALLDSILAQMIPINDTVYMTKYPVSVDEFMTMIALTKMDNVLPKYQDQVFDLKSYAEKEYYTQYCRYEDMLHSYPASWGANFPIVGLDRTIVYWFLNNLEEMYRKKNANQFVRFRLPLIKEWEYAAQTGNNRVGYPLRDRNTNEKLCNYFEIPQTWLHFNTRTEKHELVIPNEAFSELIMIETTLRLTDRNAFPPNNKGFYDLYGNASEMMLESNHTRGGSCISTGYDILNSAILESDMLPFLTGFRVVMVIKKDSNK